MSILKYILILCMQENNIINYIAIFHQRWAKSILSSYIQKRFWRISTTNSNFSKSVIQILKINEGFTHLLRDSCTSTLNRSSNRILSSSLKNSSALLQPAIISQEGVHLPLPQLFLKLEHPLIIIVIVVKRCHAARHSKVKEAAKRIER